VTVALALIGDPELMFLDEPTSQLDPQARRAIWAALERQRERRNAAIVLTTHQMEEAQRLCGRVVVLDGGRVIAEGTPASLVDRHCPGRVVEFTTTADSLLDFITEPMTRHAQASGTSRVRVEAPDVNALIAGLTDRQRRGELSFHDMRVDRQTLEDVFLKLTGRHIRE
jgi:ABC-2 type transport system ATP-binding protein